MTTTTSEGTVTSTPSSGIGAPIRRRETLRFVRGAGRYVDDVDLPGTLHARFVRSPLPHARIEEVDAGEALAMDGVLAVFDAAALAQVAGSIDGTEVGLRVAQPLASDIVRYVGDPVAVVIAKDRYTAEDAVEAVDVTYEPLTPVLDPYDAIEDATTAVFADRGTNVLDHTEFETERFAEVFAKADLVVKGTFHSGRLAACPIEPRGVLATCDVDGSIRVWTSTAGVHDVRRSIARTLAMPESKVWVHAPDVGGSFGGKNRVYPEELALPAAAKLVGSPVKWIETRTEHLTTARQGRDQTHEVEAAVTVDGRILAIRDVFVEDEGAALGPDNAYTSAWLYLTGAYDIQHYRVEGFSVTTNKVPHGALRGIGKADAAWVIERLVDRIATALDLDPADVRRRNLVPAEAFPYTTATGAVLDSGDYQRALEMALELAEYPALREEQARLRAEGIYRGIGMAVIIEPTSASRRNYGGGFASCRLRMDPTGVVSAYPNIGQQGQGHQTVIAQIVSDVLGLPINDVEVFESDTNSSPFGPITGSSRSSVILMPAAQVAAEKLRDKLRTIAAHRLEVAPDEVELVPGAVRHLDDPDRSIDLATIIRIAHQNVDMLPDGMEPALEVIGYFKNPNIVWEPDEIGRHNEFAVYPYDAGVAVVDVDVETGRVEIVGYTSVHDCGTVINPTIVRTQHLGCIVHGIGAALYEEIRYSEEGDPQSNTFMEYLLPTVNEVPPLRLGHLVTPSPFTPLGAKGAGETGMLTVPPAIGNAIEDALRPIGAQVGVLPHSAVRVLQAIREAT